MQNTRSQIKEKAKAKEAMWRREALDPTQLSKDNSIFSLLKSNLAKILTQAIGLIMIYNFFSHKILQSCDWFWAKSKILQGASLFCTTKAPPYPYPHTRKK